MRNLTALQKAVIIAGTVVYGVGMSLTYNLPSGGLRIAVAALSGGVLGVVLVMALSRGSDSPPPSDQSNP